MKVEYSGLVDVVASAEATITRIERQVQHGRTLEVGYGEVVRRLTSDVDVRASDNGAWYGVRDAVWDTGSTVTCVDLALARKMGLTQVDEGIVATMAGSATVPQFFVDVCFGRGMVVRRLRASGVDMSGRADGMLLLLGMDVISRGTLIVRTRGGETAMEFSMPGE